MVDISVREINKYYGSNHVLKGITFEIYDGEKVGLLGINGSGKTTLFKIITGDEPCDSGTLSKASGKKVEMLAQIPVFGEGDSSEDVLRSSFKEISDVYNAMKKIEGDDNPSTLVRYGRLMEEYERLGGYDTEVRLDKVCEGMNIDGRIRYSPFSQLSGGEKTRVNLARILLRDSDVLLLDEPTNHLDLASLEWLENFLRDYAGTVFVVSHDRAFLDRVVTRIIEIEEGEARFYSGNYSWYAEEKLRRYTSQSEQYERQQREIKRIEDRAKWFLEQDRFTTKHHVILSRIDHMEKIEKPVTTRKLKAKFDGGGHMSKELVTFESARKSYGEKIILRDLSLKLYRNERIALIGANGCGKTTLLRLITEEELPDSGIIKTSASLKLAYMPQIITFENMDATVMETLCYATGVSAERARSVLAGFHFRAADVIKKIGALSGGEKSRLKLCILMQENVNFLLLDEPTNHLDVASREWIENALADYGGAMLFVSHDRYFLNKFADKVWSMDNGEIDSYDCGFDEYLEIVRSAQTRKARPAQRTGLRATTANGQEIAQGAAQRTARGTGHKTGQMTERKAVRKNPAAGTKTQKQNEKPIRTEAMINAAEAELMTVNAAINSNAYQSDYVKLSELYGEKTRLEEQLEHLYNEWSGNE